MASEQKQSEQGPAIGWVPDNCPGHWDTPDGAMMARHSLTETRADLEMGEVSDLALANAQYLCDRNSFALIHYQTAAKERIRWLSAHLAAAHEALRTARGQVVGFSIGHLGPEAAVKNVEYIDTLLAKLTEQVPA